MQKRRITNISTLKAKKSNRYRSKIIAVMIIIVIFTSIFCTSVSAVSTNSWGLVTSQIDTNYFHLNGSTLDTDHWSVARQNAWILGNNLSSRFNMFVVSLDDDENMIYQLEYLYDNGYSKQASRYGTDWNNIRTDIQNLVTEVEEMCSDGITVPTINDKKVTVAEYQNLQSRLNEKRNELEDLAENIKQSYALSTFKPYAVADDLSVSAVEIFDTMWNFLGNLIKTIGTNSVNTDNLFGMSWTSNDIQNIANSISGIVKTFAYAIAVILFGISVTTTSLQYELLTLRGGIKIFARVLLVKIWIDLAIPICIYVLNIISSLAIQIFNTFTINEIGIINDSLISVDLETGNSAADTILSTILNVILNFFANIIMSLPMLAIIIVVIICVISVIIKIIARAFELTGLVSLSPLFFAALVSEETKHYFRKFISAFLSTAGYVVFIAIVYAVATQWISECTNTQISNLSDLASAFITITPRCFIIIACCRLMKKPPKVLTSLFDGG